MAEAAPPTAPKPPPGALLTPDICVIGAGSGGLSVAAAAAAFGVDVVLIEKGAMGGDCLNSGCVPSKSLLAAAKKAHGPTHASIFGVGNVTPPVDFKAVHDHVHGVIAAIAPHDSVERFEGLGVTVLQGHGRFIDRDTVAVGDRKVKARRFVIATGSSAAVPPIPGLADVPYLTNESVFELTERPEKLIVIGAGPIGCELAQAFHRLGTPVTVLEAFRALAKDDPEATALVLAALREEGIPIREEAKIARVEKTASGIRVVLTTETGEEALEASHILVAAGRKPTMDGLDLEKAGIRYDKRGIEVDAGLRTINRKVYAVGDVARSLQFTHMANYHAGLVIRSALFGLPVRASTEQIPWVTYTDPEIAHVGLTEEEAKRRYGTMGIKVLRWTFKDNDRAQAERDTRGLVKLVTTARGRLIGATIVGAGAGELITTCTLMIVKKLPVSTFTGLVIPYPTRSEALKRAALTFFGSSLTNPWVRRIIGLVRRFG